MPTPFPDPFSGFSTGLLQGMQAGSMMRQNQQAEADAVRRREMEDQQMAMKRLELTGKNIADFSKHKRLKTDSPDVYNKTIGPWVKAFASDMTKLFPDSGITPDDVEAFLDAGNVPDFVTDGIVNMHTIWNDKDMSPDVKQESIRNLYLDALSKAQAYGSTKEQIGGLESTFKGLGEAVKPEAALYALDAATTPAAGLLQRIKQNAPVVAPPSEEPAPSLLSQYMPQQQIDSSIQPQPESFEIGGMKFTPEQRKLLMDEIRGGKSATEAMKAVMSLGGKEETPYSKIDPKEYTLESIREFNKTKDYSVLVPRGSTKAPTGLEAEEAAAGIDITKTPRGSVDYQKKLLNWKSREAGAKREGKSMMVLAQDAQGNQKAYELNPGQRLPQGWKKVADENEFGDLRASISAYNAKYPISMMGERVPNAPAFEDFLSKEWGGLKEQTGAKPQGKGAAKPQAGRDASSAVQYLKEAGKDRNAAMKRIGELATKGWTRAELDAIARDAGWE